MEGWYVAKCKPQKETYLMTFLSQRGVGVFFPRIMRPGPTGGTLKGLFPTYMFCYLDPESSIWPVVRWAPGMAYILSCDGEPTRVPETMVDYLQKRVSGWNSEGGSRNLNQGDKVVVLGGPFSGLEGIFQRYVTSKERCRVLLEVVGRLASVELAEWDVKGDGGDQWASASADPVGSRLSA